MKKLALIAAATVLLSHTVLAVEEPPAELEGITNFRQYSATFASAGQPTADQLQAIADQGFERIVYIAFTNNTNALPDEDQIVKGLGMEYMHVPVDFSNPLPDDFYDSTSEEIEPEFENEKVIYISNLPCNVKLTEIHLLFKNFGTITKLNCYWNEYPN